jgi:hypothetical protein
MGTLIYGHSSMQVGFDDRLLRHLQIVIGAKLRRNESFYFSWFESDHSAGRSSVWLNTSMPLYFRYAEPFHPDINRAWIEQLALSADTSEGLRVVPEP